MDCPWCDGALEVDAAFSQVSCGDCQVTVEIAPDVAVPARRDLAA